jgi:hypothetical protein
LVNKIYDYDITSRGTTKVDLITVQDVKGYNDDAFYVSIDDLVLHFLETSYISGNITSQPSSLGTFETATDVTFANGTKEYTSNGVKFTISGNTVYTQHVSKYVDKEDADFNVTLKNKHHTGSFHCVRYSVYPYPEIKLYLNDTEQSQMLYGTRSYTLEWYGTETYGLENKPTVSVSVNGTGTTSIDASSWDEHDVMIAEGDDEWFRTAYSVTLNTNNLIEGSTVTITMTDKEGWHETRTFNVVYDGSDAIILHFYQTSYLNGNVMSNPSSLGTFETVTDVTFANGTKSYSANGVNFTISGNTVYYQSTTKYVDKTDADFYVTLKNRHHADRFHCVRYATYPYPEIKLYDSDGETERSTIYPGSRNYKLGWYGTETYGLENKPTVTIENHGTGSATINANTWTERDVMIAEGDDEWFRTEYVVDFNTNMTNYSGTYVRVTITDKEGWHDTRDFPISL